MGTADSEALPQKDRLSSLVGGTSGLALCPWWAGLSHFDSDARVIFFAKGDDSVTMTRPYCLSALQLGAQVTGIDLAKEVSKEVVEVIKQDVRKHRLLVFRHQLNISPERHLQIGRWFGQIESTFYNHPASPHRDIFRVSNDRSEGCTGVGRTGWHIDGSFQEAPFSHSIYHIIETPSR